MRPVEVGEEGSEVLIMNPLLSVVRMYPRVRASYCRHSCPYLWQGPSLWKASRGGAVVELT